MNRNRCFALAATTAVVLLLVTTTIAAQQSKFHSSQETGGAPGRYRVELELRPGDDLTAISGQVAATYGVRIEPYGEEGFAGFVILSTPARARLMSADPRVIAITDVSQEVSPVPVHENAVAIRADTATAAVEQTRRNLTTEAVPGFGTYTYDPSGNITSIGNHVFRYDTFGRVKSADLGSFGTQVYTYDRYGNILKIVTNGDEANAAKMSVDPATNQMDLPFSQSQANKIATYDAVGNVVVHEGSYTYDALNMMKETTDNASARRLHVYSASDERVVVVHVQNNVETTSEWTLRGGSNRVLRRLTKDVNGVWHWKEDYVYGGPRLLAAAVPGPEQVRHFHLDHLGTPRLITGDGGVRIAEKTYEPFGVKVSPATNDFEQLEFTGHERDLPLLDYMHARYYRPDLGRFLSVDPYLDLHKATRNPQNWNRYSYVRNNPINLVDPDGRDDVNIGPDFEVAGAPGSPEKHKEVLKSFGEGSLGIVSLAIATVILDAGPELGDGELPKANRPYQRPSGATTAQQRASVQNQPCAVCGTDDGGKRVAGHKTALVQEHYQTGTIDKQKMRSLDAVRPECPTCSAREGAAMSRYSRMMKKAVIELFKRLL
jgi:RHS repeat-associated protein